MRGDSWAGVAGAAPSGSFPGTARVIVGRVATGLASEVEAGICEASQSDVITSHIISRLAMKRQRAAGRVGVGCLFGC